MAAVIKPAGIVARIVASPLFGWLIVALLFAAIFFTWRITAAIYSGKQLREDNAVLRDNAEQVAESTQAAKTEAEDLDAKLDTIINSLQDRQHASANVVEARRAEIRRDPSLGARRVSPEFVRLYNYALSDSGGGRESPADAAGGIAPPVRSQGAAADPLGARR